MRKTLELDRRGCWLGREQGEAEQREKKRE
jgi:hypothetical protein